MLTPSPIPIQNLDFPLFSEKGVSLSIKRLDLVHPEISGNKFFKLKYNIKAAISGGYHQLLTFGGAYSNHIYATAAAAAATGFKSIGVIRGEETLPLNPTLQAAVAFGMQLHYLDRTTYRIKNSEAVLQDLRQAFGEFFVIPEGGTNEMAIKGTRELLTDADHIFSHIGLSIGTGGTFIGVAASAKAHQQLLGFPSLKGEFILGELDEGMIRYEISPSGSFKIFNHYHFGGYARYKPELISFIKEFHQVTGIPLDPIYTGKMLFGIFDLIKNDYFPEGSNILAMHTGGLQGIRGFNLIHETDLPL